MSLPTLTLVFLEIYIKVENSEIYIMRETLYFLIWSENLQEFKTNNPGIFFETSENLPNLWNVNLSCVNKSEN